MLSEKERRNFNFHHFNEYRIFQTECKATTEERRCMNSRHWSLKATFTFVFLFVAVSHAQVRTFSPEQQAQSLKNALRLSPQQTEKVLLILEDVKEELTDLNATLKNKPDDLAFARAETIANARKRIAALLREDQVQQFKEVELFPEEKGSPSTMREK